MHTPPWQGRLYRAPTSATASTRPSALSVHGTVAPATVQACPTYAQLLQTTACAHPPTPLAPPVWARSLLPPHAPQFCGRAYWDSLHAKEGVGREWYFGWEALRAVFVASIDLRARVLQLGVGTSRLQVEMARDGFRSVVSVDYSPVAIARLNAEAEEAAAAAAAAAAEAAPPLEAAGAGGDPPSSDTPTTSETAAVLRYVCADVTDMAGTFEPSCFDAVVDKGTVDGMLCTPDGEEQVEAMLRQGFRVLAPGGCFVLVSFGSPTLRGFLFLESTDPWEGSEYYVLRKRAREGQGLDYETEGPFPLHEGADGPMNGHTHYVYVARRGRGDGVDVVDAAAKGAGCRQGNVAKQ